MLKIASLLKMLDLCDIKEAIKYIHFFLINHTAIKLMRKDNYG